MKILTHPRTWVVFSGLVWLLIGSVLFFKGVSLLKASSWWAYFFSSVGICVGVLKGMYILSKTAHRVSSRILALPQPIRLTKVYSLSYLFVILFMMSLGMLFRFLPIGEEIRGMIDVTIGTALIVGSRYYTHRKG